MAAVNGEARGVDAALATLVSSYEENQDQSHGSAASKARLDAYRAIADMTREDEGLHAALATCLETETSVGRSAYSKDTSFVRLVRAVFWALRAPEDSSEGDRLRAEMLVLVTQLLHAKNATTVAPAVVGVLLQELHNVRVTDLPPILAEVLRGIVSGHQRRRRLQTDGLAVFYTIELLPHLLLRVSSSAVMLTVDGDQLSAYSDDLSGPAYRSQVLAKLCSMVWPQRFFLQVLKNLRDFPLTEPEERLVCSKVYREARRDLLGDSIDQNRRDSSSTHRSSLENLPTVFHQLLQLAGRVRSELCARLLVSVLISTCKQLNVDDDSDASVDSSVSTSAFLSEGDIRALQSTVLYHLDMATKQWEQLGKVFLVEYQNRQELLSAFDVAMLLMVASHNKFEVQVTQFLLRYVTDTYTKTLAGSRTSPRGRGSVDAGARARRAAFGGVIQCAQDGSWSPIIQQMVTLSFHLLEHRGQKGNAQPDIGYDVSTWVVSKSKLFSQLPWVDFAMRLILGCFLRHELARVKVLDHIVNMIIVQNDDCPMYVSLLARIAKRHVAEFDGQLETRIRECLEYVTHMKARNANMLLSALTPLLRKHSGLKSFVILSLRKAMFRKDETSRVIAVQGLALLLRLSSQVFTRGRTLTQLYSQNFAMMSQGVMPMTSTATPNDADIVSQELGQAMVAEDLYRQFCGIFRRALHLQTHVRLVLYAELVHVFTECPALRSSILEMLFQHFWNYYEPNESIQPPLKFDRSLAMKRGVYVEPLAHLLHTTLHCITVMRRDAEEESEASMIDDIPATQAAGGNSGTLSQHATLEEMHHHMNVLFERLKRCELSDFEFDKDTSFSLDSPGGETNRRLGRALQLVGEVCINWSVACSNFITVETWEALQGYMGLYKWIDHSMDNGDQEKSSGKGGDFTIKKKRGRPAKKIVDGKSHGGQQNLNDKESNSVADGSGAFERIARFDWAFLISATTSVNILEYATNTFNQGPEGDSFLPIDVEDIALLCLNKGTSSLDHNQDGDWDTNNLFTAQRHRSTLPADLQHHARSLGTVAYRLFTHYCGDSTADRSSAMALSSVKKGSAEAQTIGRRRLIVSATVSALVRIIEAWVIRPRDEFVGNVVDMLYITNSNCGKTDDQASSDEGFDHGAAIDGGDSSAQVRVLAALESVVDRVIRNELYDDAIKLLDLLRVVWAKFPLDTVERRLPWLQRHLISSQSMSSPRLLENIVMLLLRPHPRSEFQSAIAEQLSHLMQKFCNHGGDGEDDDEVHEIRTAPLRFLRLDLKGVLTIANAILTKTDAWMTDLECAIKEYDSNQRRNSVKFKDEDITLLEELESEFGTHLFGVTAKSSEKQAHYRTLCKRLYQVAGALGPFVIMSLNKPSVSTRVIRFVGRLCKLLVVIVNERVRRRDATLPKFLRQLFDRTAGDLSPKVLHFIGCINENNQRAAALRGRGTKVGVANTASQSKLIPDVIFRLEQYDLALMKLSKVCKGQDFSAWCQLRNSRDFRLNRDRVKASIGDTEAAVNENDRGDACDSGAENEDASIDEDQDHSRINSEVSEDDDTESAVYEEINEAEDENTTQHRRKRARTPADNEMKQEGSDESDNGDENEDEDEEEEEE